MTGFKKKSLLIAAACASIFASAGAGRAYESVSDVCRKWTGEGGGMQYKCFDCMILVGAGPNAHWVNTCADESRPDGPRYGWPFGQ
jgi:hypothetical protein